MQSSYPVPLFKQPQNCNEFVLLVLEINKGEGFSKCGSLYTRFFIELTPGWIGSPTQSCTNSNKFGAWGYSEQLFFNYDNTQRSGGTGS